MTPLAYRRLLLEAPSRLLVCLVLICVATALYLLPSPLRLKPFWWALAQLVLSFVVVGAFTFWRKRKVRSAIKLSPREGSLRDGAVFDLFANPDSRCELILQYWYNYAPEAAEEASALCHKWAHLSRQHAQEFSVIRSNIAEHTTNHYFVVIESTPQSGALFEELVEDLGVPVRRIPFSAMLRNSAIHDSQLILFVAEDEPENRVLTFHDMADRPQEVRHVFSSFFSYPNQVSPLFFDDFVRLLSGLARTSVLFSSARATRGKVND